ncbi:glycosyltransferase family 4 protein [Chloroflexus sp.]|uniref:glycosyltransferase family 4 protein n=1 Tax=Chloroflexus sp. TaxID=1904827 RepID=UPI0026373F93|nr:glycosyltransferase family 4 protein [uncultured Chloroflexus sp.]
MRILMLTLVAPYPPDSGPKIKTYNVLQYLCAHHDVTLVSLVRNEREQTHAESLRRICREVYTVPFQRSRWKDARFLLRSAFTGQSFLLSRDASPELHRLLHRLTTREYFDIIHADQLNMAPFAVDLPGGARIIDQHNAVWTIVARMAGRADLIRRIGLQIEARRLRRAEARLCACFDGMLAVSEPDYTFLRLAAAEVGVVLPPTAIIPIAIDTRAEIPIQRHANPDTILSMATMFWPPNVDGVLWFAREVWPLVRQAVPYARVALVGSRPPATVRQLAADPAITVPGYVEDPRPYLERTAALIVPVHAGGGMRVKILEALARGLPVVSTTIGYEGIEVTPGKHLLVGDTPAAFAAALIQLLRDPALGQRLAAQGRRVAEERYDWRVVCPAIEQLYATALQRAGVTLTGG